MAEELAPSQRGLPGYEGYLNFDVAVLPEALSDAGYRTYMTGKWHLGLTPETGPSARGFDRSFALLDSGAGAFGNMLAVIGPGKANYSQDGEPLDSLPKDFYSTEFYTDKLISYLDAGSQSNKPFFAYLAYSSPHWPLQAPEDSIERYRGVYDIGYDELRQRRHQALINLGIISKSTPVSERQPGEPSWDSLSKVEQAVEARKMEIYAAMISDVDRHLGRLLEYLKDSGEYENTAIIFLSDNGPEGHNLELGWDPLKDWLVECCDNTFENLGKADSYIWPGPNWSAAGNTPMRMYKGFTSQGGVQVPAFIHYPGAVVSGEFSDVLVHATDVMPTILEIASVAQPGDSFRGKPVHPIQGKSFLKHATGQAAQVHGEDYYMAWELFGKLAVRKENWKLVSRPAHPLWPTLPRGIKPGHWQLYNLESDPGERFDLSEKFPEIREQMISLWKHYADANNVILPDKTSGY